MTIGPREDVIVNCEFIGNADFYGIGVRIGFYLLWLSGFLDFAFNPKSSVAIGDAQTIFDFANLIAIIVLNGQQPPVGEDNPDRKPVFVPIILLYMFFGGAIVSATTTASFPRDWIEGGRAKKFSTAVRQIFVHSTFLAMMGYAIYFFVSGYKSFNLFAPCKSPPIGQRLFPLANPVSFQDSPIVGVVLMPLILILYCLVLYIAVQRYNDIKGLRQRRRASWMRTRSCDKLNEWLSGSETQVSWTILGSLLMLISIAWSIAALEWTIAKNEIQGVNDLTTTGQMIPFIIGIFSLPTTAWSIYKNYIEKQEQRNKNYESELETPSKHLRFSDAGLGSPNGVYMPIKPGSEQHKNDQFDLRPSSQERLHEARTF